MAGIKYADRPRSEMLAHILAQMQSSNAPVQSYGELAARLGATAFMKSAFDKQMAQENAEKQKQSQAMAQALMQANAKAQGGVAPTVIGDVNGGPGTPMQSQYKPDMQGARAGLIGDLLSGGDVQTAAAGSQLFDAMNPAPKPRETAVIGNRLVDKNDGKVVAEFPEEEKEPEKVKIAKWIFDGDEERAREYLRSDNGAQLPAKMQLALFATNGDREAARKLVAKDFEDGGDKLTIAGLLAPVVQKVINGEKISQGEQQMLDWYKSNPMAALMALIAGGGAKEGTVVEE